MRLKTIIATFIVVLAVGGAYIAYTWPAMFDTQYSDGERFYLDYGSIYAFKSDPKREYYIVASYTLHMSRERYEDVVFFDTETEAQSAGYKASEGFAEDMACVKTGLDWYDCEQRRKKG